MCIGLGIVHDEKLLSFRNYILGFATSHLYKVWNLVPSTLKKAHLTISALFMLWLEILFKMYFTMVKPLYEMCGKVLSIL